MSAGELVGLLFVIFIFVICSGYYSGVETGAYRLNRIRLRLRQSNGDRAAKVLYRLLADPQAFVCTTLVGNNISVYVATAACTYICVQTGFRSRSAELVATMVLAPILLIFAEITPKSIFQHNANTLMYKLSRSLRISAMIFKPVVFLLNNISQGVMNLFRAGEPESGWLFNTRRLRYFLAEGMEEGAITLYQNTIARNILNLRGVTVEKAMIGLGEVVMAPSSITAQELKDLAGEENFSRLPVYESERSEIVGVINILEFLCESNGDAGGVKGGDAIQPIECIREPVRLKSNLLVDDALIRLQRAKQQMGIVVDDNGEAKGIVTVKDLVEEIVGELEEW